MQENSEDLYNNFQENEGNNYNIQLNPNRKKILPKNNFGNNNDYTNDDKNANEFDIDLNNNQNRNSNEQNENNSAKQAGTNLYYDKNRNVTEVISNHTMDYLNKCLEHVGKYFNVEINDIKQKLKGCLILLTSNNYF